MAVSTLPERCRETDVRKLHNVICDMDAMAQGGFSEIAAIAQLSLVALENPEQVRHLETFTQALGAIWSKAVDIENIISAEAERVGCGYLDDRVQRRVEAARLARQGVRHD